MAGTSIGASGGLPMTTLWSSTTPSSLSMTCAFTAEHPVTPR